MKLERNSDRVVFPETFVATLIEAAIFPTKLAIAASTKLPTKSRNAAQRFTSSLRRLLGATASARLTCCGVLRLVLVFATTLTSRAQSLPESTLAQIRFEQKLNAQISLTLRFRDENGKEIRLGQYFGQKPVLLVLGYYECPMLCTLVLNGMVESAADMKWSIGREFEVLNLSINPRETPALAAAKKRTYVKRYGRTGSAEGWHFLTGDQKAIQQLAAEVGFRYAYDPSSKQYAHPSGLVVLTPEGKVSRYLFGVTYSPSDLFSALQAASSKKIGSPIRQLILLCFHYNPVTGKYSRTIIFVLRLLGIATIFGLGWLVVALVRRRPATQTPGVPNRSRDDTGSGDGCAPSAQELVASPRDPAKRSLPDSAPTAHELVSPGQRPGNPAAP